LTIKLLPFPVLPIVQRTIRQRTTRSPAASEPFDEWEERL
jgi:hypothetical protein